MKGMNRDLAMKIRVHLDEMAALLDREENADDSSSTEGVAEVAAAPEVANPHDAKIQN